MSTEPQEAVQMPQDGGENNELRQNP
jgi:hypothetical protein